ncbi:MAG: T9SS type A sorting domain-containing protein [Bacteroidetes bacterium]|nr:T9SS type A sorting domain-containing protein [Bacteroidota bacterium]
MKKLSTLIFVCLSLFGKAQFNFQHLYGGVSHERGQTLLETTNNMYLFNCATLSYGQGSADAIFIKNSNQGQIIWTKVYGLPDYDNSEFAIETNDLGYIGVGRSSVGVTAGTTDAWIYKTDSAGTLQWSKAYGNAGFDDGFVQAIRTIDNGYTFIGNTKSVGSGSYDVFLVHTDANGDTLFTRAFGTSESESGLSVIQTADGGYAICGRQQTFPNGIPESDGLIIKTDGNGDMLWSYIYGDTMWEEFESIRELPNGHFAISGSTVSFGQGNYDILLLLIDSAGVPLNAFAYGGQHADACYDLHITSDNSFVFSGYTESFGYGHSLLGSDSTNIFLLKADSIGQLVWMITYGDGLQDEAFRSAKTSDGGYMISGFTTDYTPADSTQMLFIKTDSLGFSGCHEEIVTPITDSDTMNFVSSGFVQSSGVDVVSVNLVEASITTVINDACLFASANTLIEEGSISLYPNPFTSELNIDFENYNNKNCQVKIVNTNGQIVLEENIFSSKSINTSNLLPGFYFVIISNSDQITIKKALKLTNNE